MKRIYSFTYFKQHTVLAYAYKTAWLSTDIEQDRRSRRSRDGGNKNLKKDPQAGKKEKILPEGMRKLNIYTDR